MLQRRSPPYMLQRRSPPPSTKVTGVTGVTDVQEAAERLLGARYQNYRHRYRSRCHDVYMRWEEIQTALREVLDNDAAAIETYHSVVYPAIAAPYAFCDHANKSFARQYRYLQRRHPALFATANVPQPIHALMLAQHPRLGASSAIHTLPRELYSRIHEYSRGDSHELLLRAMAFAANVAFRWHSD